METLRMKRSLDMEVLQDALPPTCRMGCGGGLFAERQISKRFRHISETSSPSSNLGFETGNLSAWSPRTGESVVETVINSLRSTDAQERVSTPQAASAGSPSDPFRAREFNPFPLPSPAKAEDLDKIFSLMTPKKKSASTESSDADGRPEGSSAQFSNGSDKLYTREEVRAAINKALSIQGASIRSEYNGILQNKLSEQFQSFTKFNQDYISRQIKGNPFSYVS